MKRRAKVFFFDVICLFLRVRIEHANDGSEPVSLNSPSKPRPKLKQRNDDEEDDKTEKEDSSKDDDSVSFVFATVSLYLDSLQRNSDFTVKKLSVRMIIVLLEVAQFNTIRYFVRGVTIYYLYR